MKTLFKALVCVLALVGASPSHADEAAVKAALAGEIVDKMPFWSVIMDPAVREFFDAKVFPAMIRRGVKKSLAAALTDAMTVAELETYKGLLDNPAYKAVLDKLGKANAMMQNILSAEMMIAIGCHPVADRPENFRKVPEFNAAEKQHYCK